MLACKKPKPVIKLNDTLHLKLNEEDENNMFLKSKPVLKLLARGPKFILAPSSKVFMKNIAADVKIYLWRITKCLDRTLKADAISTAKRISEKHGIIENLPLRFKHPIEWYEEEVQKYSKFTRVKNSIPDMKWRLQDIERSVLSSATSVFKNMRSYNEWFNISKEERTALRHLRTMDLYYGNADKNLGPVLASWDIVRKQISIWLTSPGYLEIKGKSKLDIIKSGIADLESLCIQQPKFKYQTERFIYWARCCADFPKLCSIYIIFKLHSKPKDNGIESRLIAPNTHYFTADASSFLHHQLSPFVFQHEFVLQDSLSLCRILDELNTQELDFWETKICCSDVVQLYPSIDLESGFIALQWFMESHTNIPQDLQTYILSLARLVLDNSYVEFDGIGSGIFKQIAGVAMGTSFSVVFAIIFMLWLETPVIEKYQEWIVLYKRAIDDQFFIWQGPSWAFKRMTADFEAAHSNIKFDWKYPSRHMVYLDLNIHLELRTRDVFFRYSVYSKPLNAFAYLQPSSFHQSHNFRGWIRGLLIRNLTHNNCIEDWRTENKKLFERLLAREHSMKFLFKVFNEIKWGDRLSHLHLKKKKEVFGNKCVLSTPYAPGINTLRQIEKLPLDDLRTSNIGRLAFPPSGTWVMKSGRSLGSILRKTKKTL